MFPWHCSYMQAHKLGELRCCQAANAEAAVWNILLRSQEVKHLLGDHTATWHAPETTSKTRVYAAKAMFTVWYLSHSCFRSSPLLSFLDLRNQTLSVIGLLRACFQMTENPKTVFLICFFGTIFPFQLLTKLPSHYIQGFYAYIFPKHFIPIH